MLPIQNQGCSGTLPNNMEQSECPQNCLGLTYLIVGELTCGWCICRSHLVMPFFSCPPQPTFSHVTADGIAKHSLRSRVLGCHNYSHLMQQPKNTGGHSGVIKAVAVQPMLVMVWTGNVSPKACVLRGGSLASELNTWTV